MATGISFEPASTAAVSRGVEFPGGCHRSLEAYAMECPWPGTTLAPKHQLDHSRGCDRACSLSHRYAIPGADC